MQFLVKSLTKSIRPSLTTSTARQSWVFLSQQRYSTASRKSNLTGGGNRAEEESSSEEWPRPKEVPYQPKIANSVDLIGYIHQPVQSQAHSDGSFWAGTVISHGAPSNSESESDSSINFWIPVLFEGDLARTANSYLKKNDRVHITGQILGDIISNGASSDQGYVQLFKSFHGSFSHQVMVRDLHYIDDSKASPKAFSTSYQIEAKKVREFGSNAWFDLVDKPEEWFDYRESKHNGSVSPKYPDFKKKDMSVALWLDRAPKEILSELKDVKFDIPVRSAYAKQPDAGEDQKEDVLKHSANVQQRNGFGTDHWFDLVVKPDEWFDYRESKTNGSVSPKYPDFKKKDMSVALWLDRAPQEILSDLKDVKFDTPVTSKYANKPKAEDKEESWKDLVENMSKWWDNRLNKRSPKAPDFKHKETGVGLWLSDSPSWVLERLPPPKSETNVTYVEQEMF